jgi:DNA modification methylase
VKVEQVSIEALIPYAKNARTHSDTQVAQIAASIREFGFCNPVLIDPQDGIIAGHGRVMAARKLGLESVPCVRLDHLSEIQRRAYILADNRLALSAGWDEAMLALELSALQIEGFDLDLTGFDPDELDRLMDGDPLDSEPTEGDTEPQTDRAEELRELWGVEPGQMWALGEHRLLCGDSTKAEDVARVMGGERADVCFTSPPYGQQRDYRDGATEKVSDWDALMRGVFGNLPMAAAGQVLVNLGMIHRDGEWLPYWDGWIEWMRQQGWRRFGWYVWDQGPGMPGDWCGRFAPSHEFVFHFNRQSAKPQKTKDKLPDSIEVNDHGGGHRKKDGTIAARSNPEASLQPRKIPDSVIRVMRHKARGIECAHVAVFPVELPAEFIAAWPGIAYEPFSGSGTTIIACENLNRRCRAIEISPAYVAVALQRWADHTGKTPTLIDA